MTANPPALEISPDKLTAQQWKIIFVVILAPFMAQMDSTIVNVSLSAITLDLHASLAASQWVVTGYLLALALMLPINGWLVDRIGAKKLYLFCFTGFTGASFLCGAAHTMDQLVAARLVQGMAGGLLAPLTQLMMARIAGNQMVKVFSIAAAPILIAPLFGPIIAGSILQYAGWPWLFYVNLPVGLLAIVLAWYYIPFDASMIQRRPFDMRGFLMVSPALVCLVYGFERAAHFAWTGACILTLGLLLAGAFIAYARREGPRALIDISLFKNKVFSIAAVIQFLSNGIIYAGQFLIPLYLVTGCGLSASMAGWILSVMGIGMLCMYPFMGMLTDRFGIRRVAAAGVIINFLGTAPFLWMAFAGYNLPLAVFGLFLRGLGQGSTGIPSIAAAYASVPKLKLSYATTAINIAQRLGGPIMTTMMAVMVSFAEKNNPAMDGRSFAMPFVGLIALQLVILAATSGLPVHINQPLPAFVGAK